MYTTCIFCHGALGTNDHVEHFPVGRRLAFDPAKGRLWVVCPRCARWNLAPIEERWEAVEECERAFRAVRTRVSTNQVGLARLADGMDLVRIGRPQRPEFAAWRYGRQFGARRMRGALRAGGLTALVGGVGLALTGAVVAPAAIGVMTIGMAVGLAAGREPSPFSWAKPVRLVDDTGQELEIGRDWLYEFILRVDDETRGIRLTVDYADQARADTFGQNGEISHAVFTGGEALRGARLLVPRVNGAGATGRAVRDAVAEIEAVGSADGFVVSALERMRRRGLGYSPVAAFPVATRLAIEMALHEETELRAMQGELAELEAAWRDAEQVAAIADDLLLPPTVSAFLARHRRAR